jgi:sterol desaturase/sphingolipid hydroxylase (fatty acid hydroxylase superfamily)
MMYFAYFLSWTFLLYWIHRFAHVSSFFRVYHFDHHQYITNNGKSCWEWNNLFLFNDTWKSTIDLWITEVIPTIVFSAITGQWWIMLFYYIWAAFLQEVIEHDPKFDMYPFITSGKFHLLHHRHQCNYGLFIPIWDIIFGTRRKIKLGI